MWGGAEVARCGPARSPTAARRSAPPGLRGSAWGATGFGSVRLVGLGSVGEGRSARCCLSTSLLPPFPSVHLPSLRSRTVLACSPPFPHRSHTVPHHPQPFRPVRASFSPVPTPFPRRSHIVLNPFPSVRAPFPSVPLRLRAVLVDTCSLLAPARTVYPLHTDCSGRHHSPPSESPVAHGSGPPAQRPLCPAAPVPT